MRFAETHRYRPFALVSPGFAQVDSTQPETRRRADGLLVTLDHPAAPFVAVELRVQTTGACEVLAGIGSLDGAHALATYDFVEERATIELRTDDRTRVVAVQRVALRAPFGFAFALCENQITVLTDTGTGWQPLLTTRKNVGAFLDFRRADVLDRFAYAYGTRPLTDRPDAPSAVTNPIRRMFHRGRSSPAAVKNPAGTAESVYAAGSVYTAGPVRAGPFGMAGVRDPHIVQSPDGAPYIRDGRLYLTMTCAGLGFFQQAHWGVFTLDLDDLTRLEQVAHLYFSRDGLTLGDHAGQIIADGDRFIVAVSSWGDFASGNIHVRHTATQRDVLSGVHVLSSEPLPLPTQMGAWDPSLTRIDGRWHVGFVESPSQGARFDFHPALAVGTPGDDYVGPLELVGADDSLHQCEGPILAELEGRWQLLASDGDQREYPVYELDMSRVGTLDAPYPTNIPHPQLVTVPGSDGPRHLIVTFDGTQYGESVLGYGGHGDLVVMEAVPETVVG